MYASSASHLLDGREEFERVLLGPAVVRVLRLDLQLVLGHHGRRGEVKDEEARAGGALVDGAHQGRRRRGLLGGHSPWVQSALDDGRVRVTSHVINAV